MNKHTFLTALRVRLHDLPPRDVQERLSFYEEMLNDRIEEGMTEEEAVATVGKLDEVAAAILSDVAKDPEDGGDDSARAPKRRGIGAVGLVLLSLGSLVWGPLLISAVAVLVSLLVSLWAVTVSLWATVPTLGVGCLYGVVQGVRLIVTSDVLSGIALMGAGLACAGLTVICAYICSVLTRCSVHLTSGLVRRIGKLCKRKGV